MNAPFILLITISEPGHQNKQYKILVFQDILFGKSLRGWECIRGKYGRVEKIFYCLFKVSLSFEQMLRNFHQVVVDGKADKLSAVF